MEVSVSFTDGSVDLNEQGEPWNASGYTLDETVLGRVWIPREGLIIDHPAGIRYEKYPWMEKFEFDGIKAAPARRTGIGTKGAKAFVRSLSTIYAGAYDDYRVFGGDEAFDAEAYFAHAAEHFAALSESGQKSRMITKFCGFAENMWREGDAEMLGICMETVLPVLKSGDRIRGVFENSITDEFRNYITMKEGDFHNGSR